MTKEDAATLVGHLRKLADRVDGEVKECAAEAYRHAADLVELVQRVAEIHGF